MLHILYRPYTSLKIFIYRIWKQGGIRISLPKHPNQRKKSNTLSITKQLSKETQGSPSCLAVCEPPRHTTTAAETRRGRLPPERRPRRRRQQQGRTAANASSPPVRRPRRRREQQRRAVAKARPTPAHRPRRRTTAAGTRCGKGRAASRASAPICSFSLQGGGCSGDSSPQWPGRYTPLLVALAGRERESRR